MRVPTRRRGLGLQFNLTPLIDVVFNLVIFFMITSHFVQRQESEEVDLPTATQVADEPETPRRLVITVLPDETFRVGGQAYDRGQVELLIRQEASHQGEDFEVQIRGDRVVPYGVVEPILLACARNGITRVGFKVVEE
jgi:biopolymer transport protein ExbD